MKKSLASLVYVFLGLIIGTLFIASSRSMVLLYSFDEVISTSVAIVLNVLAILLLSTLFGFLFFKLNKLVYRMSGFTQYQFRQHFYFSQAIYVFLGIALLLFAALGGGFGGLMLFGMILTTSINLLAANAIYILSHVFLAEQDGTLTRQRELLSLGFVIASLVILELFALFSVGLRLMMMFM